MASPSDGPPVAPSGALGSASSARSIANRAPRPERAGMRRTPPACAMCAPRRLPLCEVRKPIAATAEVARSRFSEWAVPKSMLPLASTSAHVSSSRSAIRSRTCGTVVRAVTFQSIRRMSSSPGR